MFFCENSAPHAGAFFLPISKNISLRNYAANYLFAVLAQTARNTIFCKPAKQLQISKLNLLK